MFVNFIIIAIIIGVIFFLGYRYFNVISEESEEEFLQDDYTDLVTIRNKSLHS